jgi:hypothetical protein
VVERMFQGNTFWYYYSSPSRLGGNRGRDRMVVEFAITYAISAYHHSSCEFESRSWRGVLDITLSVTYGY